MRAPAGADWRRRCSMKAYVVWFVVSVFGLIVIDNIVRIGRFTTWTEYAAIAVLALIGVIELLGRSRMLLIVVEWTPSAYLCVMNVSPEEKAARLERRTLWAEDGLKAMAEYQALP